MILDIRTDFCPYRIPAILTSLRRTTQRSVTQILWSIASTLSKKQLRSVHGHGACVEAVQSCPSNLPCTFQHVYPRVEHVSKLCLWVGSSLNRFCPWTFHKCCLHCQHHFRFLCSWRLVHGIATCFVRWCLQFLLTKLMFDFSHEMWWRSFRRWNVYRRLWDRRRCCQLWREWLFACNRLLGAPVSCSFPSSGSRLYQTHSGDSSETYRSTTRLVSTQDFEESLFVESIHTSIPYRHCCKETWTSCIGPKTVFCSITTFHRRTFVRSRRRVFWTSGKDAHLAQ